MSVVRDHKAPPDHRAAARERLVAKENGIDLSALTDAELEAFAYLCVKIGRVPVQTGWDHSAVAAHINTWQPYGSGDPAPITKPNE